MALLSVQEALDVVSQHAATLPVPPVQTVQLQDASPRVSAAPLLADRDQPPFARSTRDGFAVRAADLMLRQHVRVKGSIRAGERWQGTPVEDGEAIEIMTGAPLPQGADSVLMLEHGSYQEAMLSLSANRELRAGENVVSQGSEAKAGEPMLATGVRMRAAEIALAASVGASTLPVYAQPHVALLATGDELVPVHEVPAPFQIRNSNTSGLAVMVRDAGAIPEPAPIVPDTLHAVEQAIEANRHADLLLFTGGVSAGAYDFVEPALARYGAEFYFTGVAMQPGKPVVFGRLPATGSQRAQYFFGLPGNPVSTQVTFLLYVAPFLRALGGERGFLPPIAQATLRHDVHTKIGLTRFLPAYWHASFQGASVQLMAWQGSGDLHANARANCYVVVPPDRELLSAGDTVPILLR